MKFQKYKRGSLIMVDFSPSMGSEMKGRHLAIVLTKNDSPNNGVLTVVPLSSKNKPYYLDLGNFLLKDVLPYLGNNLEKHLTDYYKLTEEGKLGSTDADIKNQKKELIHNLDLFCKVVTRYNKMNKSSYALIQNITTISKIRILKPMNKYDPIANLKVSDEILDKIDSKIIETLTGKKEKQRKKVLT